MVTVTDVTFTVTQLLENITEIHIMVRKTGLLF